MQLIGGLRSNRGQTMTNKMNESLRLLRVREIVKPGGMLPICRSTFYQMVSKRLVSPGIQLGARTRVWREAEIISLIDRLEAKGGDNA